MLRAHRDIHGEVRESEKAIDLLVEGQKLELVETAVQ